MASKAEKLALLAFAFVATFLLVAGWQAFWFLTDDAFISYRYISNALMGHGYVWNPAPFQPVEGYTNFLWVVLLDAVWRISGVAPPEAANAISLVFSFGTLCLAAALTLRIPWSGGLVRFRVPLVGLVLLGTVGNRSFLAWTSSGLETAMFNFLLLGWLALLLAWRLNAVRLLLATLAASLLALTRPDGLLFLVATVVAAGCGAAHRSAGDRLRLPWGLLPAVLVPVHLVWRKGFYGDWLPNTYYAKVTGPWPESGLRYAGAFVLEYALWVGFALALFVWLRRCASLRAALRRLPADAGAGAAPSAGDREVLWVRCVALSAVAAHLLYYTLIVGGDHFEYRVYSYLVPLVFVAFVWLLDVAQCPPRWALGSFAAFVALSFPIPWTHWALSQGRTTREQTQAMFVPVAPAFPEPFQAYARVFDSLQAWLIEHYVCMRHQEHKVAQQWWSENVVPGRAEGLGLRPAARDLPILALRGGVGTTAWVLPHVNVIDLHGLNDRVIGRTPPPPGQPRRMAHARVPPPGYVEALAPNVRILPGRRVVVVAREAGWTPESVREVERAWVARTLGRGGAAP